MQQPTYQTRLYYGRMTGKGQYVRSKCPRMSGPRHKEKDRSRPRDFAGGKVESGGDIGRGIARGGKGRFPCGPFPGKITEQGDAVEMYNLQHFVVEPRRRSHSAQPAGPVSCNWLH